MAADRRLFARTEAPAAKDRLANHRPPLLRQQFFEPPHPGRERIAVGVDGLPEDACQIGAILIGKVRDHAAGDIGKPTVWRQRLKLASTK